MLEDRIDVLVREDSDIDVVVINDPVVVRVGTDNSIDISSPPITTIPIVIGGEIYDGPYSITPSDERQVLSTTYLTPTQDIIIEPIPENYGKISWDGFKLVIT